MIIDMHAHLGDVLQPCGGDAIGKKGVKFRTVTDTIWWSELLAYRAPWLDRLGSRYFMDDIIATLQRRSASATLENLGRSLSKNGVGAVVVLPVPPHVFFGDLVKAAAADPRLLPFTGLRADLGDGAPNALREDAKNGARGVKLHAILQKLPYTDPLTYAVLEEARALDLPVIFHAGRWSYYLGADRERENPALGAAHFARKMVEDFPGVRFIAAHSGLEDSDLFRAALKGKKNVWMETSFGSPGAIRGLVRDFGPERVLHGSDWPFGRMEPAISSVRRAAGRDASLLRRLFSENARELLGL